MLTFPALMYQTLEKKAERMGILFPEYIRYLAMKDVAQELESIEMVDAETSKRMQESKKAYVRGDYVIYDPLTEGSIYDKLKKQKESAKKK